MKAASLSISKIKAFTENLLIEKEHDHHLILKTYCLKMKSETLTAKSFMKLIFHQTYKMMFRTWNKLFIKNYIFSTGEDTF